MSDVGILIRELARERAIKADLLAACEAFVGYYDQSGVGPCREGEDDKGEPDGFDGDERFNVRNGRAAIRRAKGEAS